MDIVLGVLPSLIPKLGELLADEYNLQKRVKGEIMFLQSKLESFKGALEDISRTPPDQLDEVTKIWGREVRELSYDMERSVDGFMVECKADKKVKHHGFKDVIKNKVDLLIQPIKRHKFAAEIRNIKSRIHGLVNKRPHKYNIEDNPYKHVSVDPRLSALYVDQARLVGIDSAKAELVKIIWEMDELMRVKIVSIVGVGGLGKTTLANVVYRELKDKFYCSAFVSVSQTPNMNMIFKSLLDQFGEYNRGGTLEDNIIIIDKLREFLKDKRYLVVIDDIWDNSDWMMIRCAFLENGLGSRIIMTTRNLNVVELEHAGYAYKMRPLSFSDSRRLFYNRIFGHEYKDICPEELLEVSDKILEKCDGVPLAIIAAASILANKQVNEKEWHDVYNSLDLDMVGMRKILFLSYNGLSSTLRTCFLYLNVFPENCKIDKALLIWMWIAEGFIQSKGQEKNLFELGERYFNELINRSMIQPVYNNGMIEHCYVQNMVLNLIHDLSSEENFVTILSDEYGTSAVDLMPRIQRLSIQNGKEDRTIIQPTTSIMQQVRSVIVFSARMPVFASLRHLCVLDLNYCDLSQGLILKYLGRLFYLKYLGLSNTHIAQLPEEVGNLEILQTLRVTCNKIANLPSTIVQLKHLMCLRIDMDMRVPNGIASLTSLEELSQIGIYDSADIDAVGCLTELRVLDIYCHTERMDSLEKSLVDCLCKLQKLQNLSIWVASGECKLDALILPPHLCRLSLHGCWLSTLTNWVSHSSLRNMSSISIAVIELQMKDLENLGRLPCLCYLNLKVDHENLGTLREFAIGPGLFECLVSCVFWGFRGPVTYTQAGVMPRLTSLLFTLHVKDMREIPGSSDAGYNLGLENLLVLQEVAVLIRCGGASNEEVEDVKAALRHSTKNHPNHPTIDFIGYEDKEEMIDRT